jgi:hypothetical protein
MVDSVREVFGFGLDTVVIRKFIDGIKGGKALNVEDFAEDYIKAGHVVIRKEDDYKPLPVEGEAFAALPEGYEYIGFVTATKSVKEPFVAIVTIGEVNDEALPYTLSSEQKAAIKAAVPTIVFNHD